MLQTLTQRVEQKIREGLSGLRAEEAAVLALLQQRLAQEVAQQKRAA